MKSETSMEVMPAPFSGIKLPSSLPFSGVNLPTSCPAEYSRLIELLCDIDLTLDEVDVKMMGEFPDLGWKTGTARSKIKRYPILKRTVVEGRMLNWRELGRSKADVYRVISEAMDAVRVDADGVERADHEVRMKSAVKMAKSMGEPLEGGDKVSVNVAGEGNKILIMTSEGKPIDDC